MRFILGIAKLYWYQTRGQLQTSRYRVGFIITLLTGFLLGYILSVFFVKEFFTGNEINTQALPASIIIISCGLLLAILALVPFVFFTRDQVDEMMILTQYPLNRSKLIIFKYLDLSLAFVIMLLMVSIPIFIQLTTKAFKTGNFPGLFLYSLFLLGFLSLTHFIGYIWSFIIVAISKIFHLCRYVRLIFLVVLWAYSSIALVVILPLVFSYYLGEKNALSESVQNFFSIYIHGGWYFSIICLAILYTSVWLVFRISSYCLEYLYVKEIFTIKNQLANEAAPRQTQSFRIRIPLLPRSIKAICLKDLFIYFKSFEFWFSFLISSSVFLTLGITNNHFLREVILGHFPGLPADFATETSVISTADIVIPFIIFVVLLMQIGLSSFKLEGKDCQNLIAYPVTCTTVVLGKALAFFIIISPFLIITLIHVPSWLESGFAWLKIIYVLLFVFLILVVCMIISGATVKHSASNLLMSVSYETRILFSFFLIIALSFFFLLNIFCEFFPFLYFIAVLFISFAIYFLVSHAHFFIKGLSTRGENFDFKKNRYDSLYKKIRIQLVFGLFLLFPVFIVFTYTYSGLRGFEGQPLIWQCILILWPVFLAFIAFWKKLKATVRIFLFALLLITVPLIIVLKDINLRNYEPKYSSFGKVFSLNITDYPTRFNSLMMIHNNEAEIAKQVYKKVTSNKKVKPAEQRVPDHITKKYGYKTGITLNELWQGHLPEKNTIKDFITDISRHNNLTQYDTQEKWQKWLLPAINYKLAEWMKNLYFDTKPNQPRKKYLLQTFSENLFLKYFTQLKPKEQFSILTDLPFKINDDNWYKFSRLLNKVKIRKLTPEVQLRLLKLINEIVDRKAAKNNKKEIFELIDPVKPFFYCHVKSKQVRKSSKGYIPYFIDYYIGVLEKFTIPEAFDKIQELMVHYMPETLQPHIPAKLFRGNELIAHQLEKEVFEKYPVYMAFVWSYHPSYRQNREFIDFFLKYPLKQQSLRLFTEVLRKRNNSSEKMYFYRKINPTLIKRNDLKLRKFYQNDYSSLLKDFVLENPEYIEDLFYKPFYLNNGITKRYLTYIEYSLGDNYEETDKTLKQKYEKLRLKIKEEYWKIIETHPEQLIQIGKICYFFGKKENNKLRRKVSKSGLPLIFFLDSYNEELNQNRFLAELISTWLDAKKIPGKKENLWFVYHFYKKLLRKKRKKLALKWILHFTENDDNFASLKNIFTGDKVDLSKTYDYYFSNKLSGYKSDILTLGIIHYYYRHGHQEKSYLLNKAFNSYSPSLFSITYPARNLFKLFLTVFWVPAVFSLLFLISGVLFCLIPGYRNAPELIRSYQFRPSFGQAVVLLIGLIIIQFPIASIFTMAGFKILNPFTLTFINGISFALILWLGLAWFHTNFRSAFQFRSFPVKILPGIIIFLLGLSFICSEADNALQNIIPMPKFMLEQFKHILNYGVGSLIVICVCAPITEELMFRGLILQGFIKNYGRFWAVILSSILFALVHLNPYQFFGAFICGLFLGWLYCRTESLWPCIFAHAFFNSIGFWVNHLLKVKIPGYNYNVEGQIAYQPFWFNLIGILLLILGLFLIWIVMSKPKNQLPTHA